MTASGRLIRVNLGRPDNRAIVYRDQHPELAAYTGETVWFRKCAACGFTQPERLPSLPGFFDRLYDQAYGLPREGRAALLTLRARAK